MRSLAAVSCILMLAGCSTEAHAPTVGALGDLDDNTKVCSPLRGDSRVLLSWDSLRNRGDDPVTVTGVELLRARQATLVGAQLYPLPRKGGYSMFGVERINRTRKLTPAATEALHSARPAKDATIAPGEHVGLIVDIRVGGDNASMGPTRVNYTSDGESHYWTGGTDLRLAAGGCGA